MDLTPVHTLNFTGVLFTSRKIILANYWHFFTLSLFFLPLSFTLITLPDHPFSNHHPNHHKLIPSYLLYTLIIHLFSLCAIATITYITHHAFSGRPVNISDALTSLISSFFPLAFTVIIAYAIIFLISLTFLMFVGSILMLVQNFGFVIDYNSTSFMWFLTIAGLVLTMIITHFHVNWSLAFAVVVVESKWGFAALVRSAYLVKGMRWVWLLVVLYSGVCGAGIVWICSKSLDVVVLPMLGLFFLMMFLLGVTAANTVLYNYSMVLHGEVVIEGFDHEYMNLPGDGEKVPHVVTVVAA